MMKKIVCVLLALSVVLISLSGCGKQVKTVTVDNKTAAADFEFYKKEIISIMDKSGMKYKLNDVNLNENSKNSDVPLAFFAMTLETEKNEAIIVALTLTDKMESFAISLDIKRKKLDECKINIRDYPVVQDIYNLVSEIHVSTFACNHFLNSSRRGMEDKYKFRPDVFNISENKYFSRDKTHTWVLQYQITQQASDKTNKFDETLIFKGNLASRTK